MKKKKITEKSEYQKLHRPAKEFASRKEYLEHELEIMSPKRWGLNLPRRDFNFEFEDFVPAIAATIGKIVMVTAIVAAFASGLGLSQEFVVENVRFELVIAALLFVIPISGFFNPKANLAGTHGPIIPLIGLIVLAGGHPLALGVSIGVFGLLLTWGKGGSKLVKLTGTGVRGGLLIFLGMMGLLSQMGKLRTWSSTAGGEHIFLIIIFVTILIYSYLARIGKRWLSIPVASLFSLTIALILGAPFEFTTSPGLPIINPFYWWGADTGWMLGLPNLEHFIAVVPFAILAIAMWPPDFLGHKVFQEMNYPKKAEKVFMDVDDTMAVASVRQIAGSILGGGNIASSWGTYMIPAAIAKRPIPAGAILTGIGCILAAFLGFPMDIAMWAPVLKVALIVGVFLPLLEAGMQMIRETKEAQTAAICMFGSVLINPVFGWAFAMFIDNSGILGNGKRSKSLSLSNRIIIPLITLIVTTIAMAVVGMIPGIPVLI